MTDATLLYKIATAYYEDGLTQDQIGKRFGLSRIKVSRLLQQARQSRVVQITILPPPGSYGDRERELEQAYGLDEVVIAGPGGSQAAILADLGAAGAAYLARCLNEQRVIAISWGTTLLALIEALSPQHLPDLRVVQMLGGLGRVESETYGADLTLRLAQMLGAKARLIPAPGIVGSQMVRDALLQDANIAETLALAAKADLAIVGIGVPDRGTILHQSQILTDQEIDQLRALSAVGDIALRFFDRSGQEIAHPINERIIGLDLAQLKRIPRVVGIAGGQGKYEVIRGAVRGRLIDVLITDDVTAGQLLQETQVPVRSRNGLPA
jgi:DNA-binding transcriptional regulator LsrR (DeoR family)